MIYDIYVPLVGYAYVRCEGTSQENAIDWAMRVAAEKENPEVLEYDLEAVSRINLDWIDVQEVEVVAEEEEW